jgi:hypothetical protein
MADTYWAAQDGVELLQNLETRVDNFDEYLNNTGILNELRDSYVSDPTRLIVKVLI